MSEMYRPDRTILIASSSRDAETCRPVAEELTNQGYDVRLYEADRVVSGEVDLTATVSNQEGLVVEYDGRRLSLGAIAAAWFRRPSSFGLDYPDKAWQMSVSGECHALQASLWRAVPDRAWLNHPDRIERCELKLGQLVAAAAVGFTIPETTVTNDWDVITQRFSDSGGVVVKPSHRFYHTEDGERKTMHTLAMDQPPGPDARQDKSPFPGFWQPHLKKDREWKVIVLGGHIFPAAIYTDETAKDDYRLHEHRPGAVTYVAEPFPDDQAELCFAFLERQGLRFGTFDFIENSDGIFYLECNPNGQYGMVSRLGYPIAKAMASELVSIADAA